jgi:hypothetical protein
LIDFFWTAVKPLAFARQPLTPQNASLNLGVGDSLAMPFEDICEHVAFLDSELASRYAL